MSRGYGFKAKAPKPPAVPASELQALALRACAHTLNEALKPGVSVQALEDLEHEMHRRGLTSRQKTAVLRRMQKVADALARRGGAP